MSYGFHAPLRGFVIAAAVLVMPAVASAFDTTGNRIVDAFVKASLGPQIKLKAISQIDEVGNDVTIGSITFAFDMPEDDGGTLPVEIAMHDTRLVSPAFEDGVLVVPTIDVQAASIEGVDVGLKVEIGPTTITEARLTDGVWDFNATWADQAKSYKAMVGGAVTIKGGNATYATASGFKIENVQEGEEGLRQLSAVDNLVIQDAGAFFLTMGAPLPLKLSDHPIELVSDFSWDPATGRMALDELRFGAKSLATITVSGAMGGVTEAMMTELAKPNLGDEAFLTQLKQMDFDNAEVAIRDEGLAGILTEFGAKQMGVDASAFRVFASGAAAGVLIGIQDVELRNGLTNAVTAMLGGNATVTLRSEPATPLRVGTLEGMGGQDPQEILKLFNVSVESSSN